MEQNELRVGNWVLTKDILVPSDSYKEMHIIKGYQIDLIAFISKGIPLTMEIVQKLGFVDYAKNGWGCRLYLDFTTELFYNSEIMYKGSPDAGMVRYQSRGSGFTHNFEIKYLHQLQNLYYVITGKELQYDRNQRPE